MPFERDEREALDLLFLGHSLIEFYDWQNRFPEHRVINLGVAGETVEGLLARIDMVCAAHQTADFVFLMTGLNNIAMEDLDFTVSYRRIIAELRTAYPAARLCMHTILPVRLEFIANETIRQVNRTLRDLAAETGAEFIDLYDHFVDARGEAVASFFCEDGVHLSADGYQVWAGFLARVIGKTKRAATNSGHHPA
jgi:lysophospholipase L1-like esterase